MAATISMPTVEEQKAEDAILSIVKFLRSKVQRIPDVGIVCGSGLAGLSKTMTNTITIEYKDIPGFPRSTVAGHTNELVFGEIGDKYVMCMRGRFHCYEGWTMQETAIGVRVMAALGCRVLIATNAAGGVNPSFRVGDLMVFKTHVSLPGLSGMSPLVGENDERFGDRFPAQSYDTELQRLAFEAAKKLDLPCRVFSGAYCHVSGPAYETLGEIGYLRSIGGDAVGMSTVPEMTVGFHSSLRVLGLSLITNQCMGPGDQQDNRPTHEEVLEATKASQDGVRDLVKTIVETVDLSETPTTRAGLYFANIK